MDGYGWSLVIGALGVTVSSLLAAAVAAIAKYKKDRIDLIARQIEIKERQDTLERSQNSLWYGTISRGFVGAHRRGWVVYKGSRWYLIPENPETLRIRELYSEKVADLKALAYTLKNRFKRKPTDFEISRVIEEDKPMQQWIMDHICPALQIENHECIALACALAQENGDEPNKPGSDPLKFKVE